MLKAAVRAKNRIHPEGTGEFLTRILWTSCAIFLLQREALSLNTERARSINEGVDSILIEPDDEQATAVTF